MTNKLPVVKKKICMLGGYAVGKTSLVRHYVEGIFSEKYQITIGVKIDKKTVRSGDQDVMLMLWDVAGEEDHFTIPPSYMTGMHGFLLVIDGTRAATYEQALDIQERAAGAAGDVPFVAVINKCDLHEEWEFADRVISELEDRGWTLIQSSAKTGQGVEEAFAALTRMLL